MDLILKCGEQYLYNNIKTVTIEPETIEVEGNFKKGKRNIRNIFRKNTIKNLKDFYEYLKQYKKRFDLEGKCSCGSTNIIKVEEGLQTTKINSPKQEKSFKRRGDSYYICKRCKKKLTDLQYVDKVIYY